MTYALGIDLGTTYTAAGLWREGRAETVPLADRTDSIPSVLYLREDGAMLVGDVANRRGTTDPDRLAREFKRRLGDDAPLLLGEREIAAHDLTGYLLRWVVDKVREREGAEPAHVTLTCPATWGSYRRELMTAAAATAGLTDVGLLSEPVAAAVYYASQRRLEPGALVAVYDLGGGTFDATVVRKTGAGFEIQGAAGGDDSIGGTDFDQVVMDHVAVSLGVTWDAFDLDDPAVLAGLAQVRAHAVHAKEALSTDVDATIPVILPDFARDVRITRGELEAAIRIPVLRTIDTLAHTVADAGVEPADLDTVLLVGGSSRIPLVSRLIASEIGVPVAVDVHPKYAVCLGAAVSAGSRLTSTASYPGPPPAAPRPPAPTAPAPTTVAPSTVSAPTPPAGPATPAGAAGDEGAELLAESPTDGRTAAAAAAVDVDFVTVGIHQPLDVLVTPTPDGARQVPALIGRDEPLTVAHTGDARTGRRTALVVSAAAAALVVTVSVAAIADRAGGPEPQVAGPGAIGTAGATPSAAPAGPAAPAATLRALPVPARAGDVMQAVAVGPGGALVAVGRSTTDGVPRSWRYRSGRWSAQRGPTAGSALRGDMRGVAYVDTIGLVAVGWVAPRGTAEPAPADRRPAIWTSTDARSWRLLSAPVTGGPARLGELFDVAARPGGGFLATGVQWGADPHSGDAAVLSSADGRRWRQIAVRGLDGPGPTTVRRLVPAGGRLVAVGARLNGSVTRPTVWTSPDASTWTVAADLASPGTTVGSAWGAARLPDGSLLVTGFATTTAGGSQPLLWTGRDPSSAGPRSVTGGTGAIYGAVATAAGITAVGARPSGRGTVPAAWTVRLS